MTVQEFFAWDSGDVTGRRWQLVDGVPTVSAAAPAAHGAVHAEVGALIGNHLLATESPFRVLSGAGIVPLVFANENFRIADLVVTQSPPTWEFAVAKPTLVVEILSDYDEAETWSNIWTYATVPSVIEIALVHSTRMEVELLRRDPDGNWPASPVLVRPPERLVLASISFEVAVAELYRTAGVTR
jgi:Uma2 family endonuclease